MKKTKIKNPLPPAVQKYILIAFIILLIVFVNLSETAVNEESQTIYTQAQELSSCVVGQSCSLESCEVINGNLFCWDCNGGICSDGECLSCNENSSPLSTPPEQIEEDSSQSDLDACQSIMVSDQTQNSCLALAAETDFITIDDTTYALSCDITCPREGECEGQAQCITFEDSQEGEGRCLQVVGGASVCDITSTLSSEQLQEDLPVEQENELTQDTETSPTISDSPTVTPFLTGIRPTSELTPPVDSVTDEDNNRSIENAPQQAWRPEFIRNISISVDAPIINFRNANNDQILYVNKVQFSSAQTTIVQNIQQNFSPNQAFRIDKSLSSVLCYYEDNNQLVISYQIEDALDDSIPLNNFFIKSFPIDCSKQVELIDIQ